MMLRLCVFLLLVFGQAQLRAETITVGSKMFTESHVLAELLSLKLEQAGYTVERKLSLGGTMVVWEALQAGELDIYPEYSGTLGQTILHRPDLSLEGMQAEVKTLDLDIAAVLGFNNSYAMAISGPLARELELEEASQLVRYPELRLGFSHEFLNRADGWPSFSQRYGLTQQVRGMEHALTYRAIANGQLDGTDAFTTDGELEAFDLVLLEDNLDFFPRYDAIFMVRAELPEKVIDIVNSMDGTLDADTIRRLNALVGTTDMSPREVAAQHLGLDIDATDMWSDIAHNTGVHLQLTGTALALACLFAIPLALLLTQYPRVATAAVYLAGLLQTIPSLALLAMMIPVLGLGVLPAVVALFLYSLLPIIRNTLTGISSVDPLLREVAQGMGLTSWQRLRKVEIPLALPTILAGIKTAAIISIGTATLAAFVGAGGLGEPIVTGLNLNDDSLILQGAIPAAVLAITAEFLFELLERALLPRHLVKSR
jgi:osmoprotectant transport system permease protein